MKRQATLSVLVPNYNHAHYLEGYVTDLLKQSWPPDEIIIVDDASSDNSIEVIRKLAARDSRIRWFRNECNMGVVATLGRALHESSGEYVYGGAADDGVLPGVFEKAMKFLLEHPDAGLCFGYTLSLNHQTGSISENSIFLTQEPKFLSADELAEAMDRIAIPGHAVDVPGNAAIWKRSEHLRTGGYRGNLRWHSDWFALQVVAMRCGACFIPEPLALTRIDHASFSRGGRYQWDKQKIVLESILELLRSDEFADVLPRFQKGKVLSQMAPWAVRVIVGQPRYWDRENALLIENSLLRYHEEHLNDPDPVVREGTCVCLGYLEKRARELRVPLAMRSRDREPAVRRAALIAHAAVCGGASAILWPIHYLVGESREMIFRAMQATTRVFRPIAARIYQRINYRIYTRLAVFEESLAALIREHAGQIEKLRAEVESLRTQMHTELTVINAAETSPAILQISRSEQADDDMAAEQSPSTAAVRNRGQAA